MRSGLWTASGALLLCLFSLAAPLSAQTVIVAKAPPDAKVELVLNGETVATGVTDASGNATLVAKPSGDRRPGDMDAHVFVETCADVRRVIIIDRRNPLPVEEAGCARAAVGAARPDLYLVRRETTLLVNVDGPNPTVLLRQGRFTLEDLQDDRTWTSPATGLVLSGGAGINNLGGPADRACGDITGCDRSSAGLALMGGATFWFSPYVGAEVSYLRPAEVSASGSGTNFRFDSTFEAHVLTVSGKAGVPIGPVRLFGKAGGIFHRATFSTNQSTDAPPEGGLASQSFEVTTEGWTWGFGGGLEVWLRPAFGLYLEGGRAKLKGEALAEAEGEIDDALPYLVFGAAVRIFGR